MLVLSRKVGEKIVIGDSIIVEILEFRGDKIRIGITAPKDTTILREELLHRSQPESSDVPTG